MGVKIDSRGPGVPGRIPINVLWGQAGQFYL